MRSKRIVQLFLLLTITFFLYSCNMGKEEAKIIINDTAYTFEYYANDWVQIKYKVGDTQYIKYITSETLGKNNRKIRLTEEGLMITDDSGKIHTIVPTEHPFEDHRKYRFSHQQKSFVLELISYTEKSRTSYQITTQFSVDENSKIVEDVFELYSINKIKAAIEPYYYRYSILESSFILEIYQLNAKNEYRLIASIEQEIID